LIFGTAESPENASAVVDPTVHIAYANGRNRRKGVIGVPAQQLPGPPDRPGKPVEDIGVETLILGSDYPHTDGAWPESPKYIAVRRPCARNRAQDHLRERRQALPAGQPNTCGLTPSPPPSALHSSCKLHCPYSMWAKGGG
jgi:hypothetical protein